MRPRDTNAIGYVLKMYPRVSETFILTEVLAHEAGGWPLEIFSLRPPVDGRFHEGLSRVQAPVTYLPSDRASAETFWQALTRASGSGLDIGWLLGEAGDVAPRDVLQAVCLAEHVRDRGIRHLHAHFATAATTVARLAARMAGVPYSFTAHAKDIYHESVEEADLRRKLRDAAAVVTVSDYNLDFLRRHYGGDSGVVTRIYNGLDLDEFAYAPATNRPRTIMAVGRLVEKKGFDVLIDACAILARDGVDFACEIAGDGALRENLESQITQCGVEDRVHMLGSLPRGEIIRRVLNASVLAVPCVVAADGNRDGLPTVIIEAMALGTPCVSTPVTGIPEIVRDDDTGLLVPERDAPALADALRRLLDDADLRSRLSRGARTFVEEAFDIHRNTRAMRELLQTIAAPRLVS